MKCTIWDFLGLRIINHQQHNSEYNGIGNIVVTTTGIIKLLNDLKPSKSAGPDEIHPHETSKLPEGWRVAIICPIYKKGDRSRPNNYRLVSLTSVVCKVLEHIVCSNIMNHLDAYGLIMNIQHAFHKGRICATQLCTVIHDWSKTIDQGLHTDVFILDFAKAFDSVPHQRDHSKSLTIKRNNTQTAVTNTRNNKRIVKLTFKISNLTFRMLQDTPSEVTVNMSSK